MFDKVLILSASAGAGHVRAAQAVVADQEAGVEALGVVFGGSGNGEQIAANKVRGVRAALVWSIATAELARERVQPGRGAVAEDEVVRRRPQRDRHRLARLLDEPELVLGVQARVVADYSGEAEDEVVARLVGQQRQRPLEPCPRLLDLDDLQEASVHCIGDA